MRRLVVDNEGMYRQTRHVVKDHHDDASLMVVVVDVMMALSGPPKVSIGP